MGQKKDSLGGKRMMNKNVVLWGIFFKKLLQNINASVMVTNSRGHIIFVNEQYLDFFSFSEEDVIGKYWIDSIIPASKRQTIRRIFKSIKEKKTLGRFDTPVLTKGNVEEYLSWIGIPLRQKQARLYMFIGRKGKCPPSRTVRVHSVTRGRLNTAHKEVIEALFAASRISEPDTAKHATRVMSFAVALAKKLKVSRGRIEKLKVACLLHDLGKLAVDKKILFKKGKLSKDEFDQVKRHPHWGSEIARFVYFLHDIVPIMANHHENYDGSGYPGGIKGSSIPLEARILSVVDIYEALTSDRPYRKRFSPAKAIAIMEEEKGRKLDPRITDVFLDMARKGKLAKE